VPRGGLELSSEVNTLGQGEGETVAIEFIGEFQKAPTP
jgi:hypothetical protein